VSYYLINFGSGRAALARTLEMLRGDDSSHDAGWLGSLLRSRNDHDRVAEQLIELFREANTDRARRRIILAAAAVEKRGVTPILIKGLEDSGEVRYRSLQALYRLYGRNRLPEELRRVRQYYYHYRRDSRDFGEPKYDHVHRVTARAWVSYLRHRYPDRVQLRDHDRDDDRDY